MPRLGGREALAQLRTSTSTSTVRIVIMAGSSDETIEAQLIEEGADDFIRKPVDSVRFTARIKAVLRRSGECGGR